MVTYQVVYWSPVIRPEDRNNRNLSDGVAFQFEEDAQRFVNRLRINGGKLCRIQRHENGTEWLKSLHEYDRLSEMSAAEIAEIRARR